MDDSDAGDEDTEDENGVKRVVIMARYEKVERVKTQNKWKIVLKDGIVCVGGKEYIFSKCTGDFEW